FVMECRCNQGFSVSSRRRHTRSKRDWSSDVCSSDLTFGCNKARAWDGEIGEQLALAVVHHGASGHVHNQVLTTGTIAVVTSAIRSDERRVGKERECTSAATDEKGMTANTSGRAEGSV